MTTPTPTKLIPLLTSRPSLVVVPVEPQPLIPTREHYRYMHDARLANVVKSCPLEVGRQYYVPERWQLGTGDGVKCGINIQVQHEPWLYEVAIEHREAAYALGEKCGYGGKWQPARTMKPWMTPNHYTVKSVECRQVRTITEAEAELLGMPHCEQCESPNRGQWGRGAIDDPLALAAGGTPFHECSGVCNGETLIEWLQCYFTRDHGPAAWSDNAWCWFAALAWEK